MQGRFWVKTIFDNEFDLFPDRSPEQEAEEWIDEFVVGDSFEEFYEEQIENAEERKYVPGENRAYAIRSPPFNCEGKVAAAAIAGEFVYDKDLDVLTEWDFGKKGKRNNPHRMNRFDTPTTFNGHISLIDEEGNTYGSTSLLSNPKRQSLEKIAGIYLTNLADEANFNDKRKEPEHYLAQIDLDIKSPYAGARRQIVESRAEI